MTDFSTMTDDQLAEWLATSVMGWMLDLVENEWGLRYYRDADGKSVMDARLWQPTRDLNQAVECADFMANLGYSWSVDNIENDHYHASVYRPSTEIIYFGDATDNPARVLCEAVAMAVEGKKE